MGDRYRCRRKRMIRNRLVQDAIGAGKNGVLALEGGSRDRRGNYICGPREVSR